MNTRRPTHAHMTPKHIPQDSALTFAVIFDPENGLELFSGTELLSLSDQESGVSHLAHQRQHHISPNRPHIQAELDDERPMLFRGNNPYLVDILSSPVYQRKPIVRRPPPSFCSSEESDDSASFYSTDTAQFTDVPEPIDLGFEHHQRPALQPPTQHPQQQSQQRTPHSTFTFAALWDSDTGISAFKDGVPFPTMSDQKHSKSGSLSTINFGFRTRRGEVDNTANSDQISVDALNAFRPRFFVPRLSRFLYRRNAAPSSTLEGYRSRSYSFFDPLNHTFSFDPNQAFSQFETKAESCGPCWPEGMSKGDSDVIDDEGFFEMSSHHDCDPHLPSRFSMTTTSTSTYVAIDPKSVPPAAMLAFNEENLPRRNTRPPPRRMASAQADYSKSLPPPPPSAFPRRERKLSNTAESVARLSRAIKKRWSFRRPQDERWVLVEIQSVVTDRVIEEE